jgi:hypothetical protein
MQGQRRMSYSGTGLLVLALGSALWAMTDGTTALSVMVIFAVLSATWLVAARLWRRLPAPGSLVLLAGGIAFWLVALWGRLTGCSIKAFRRGYWVCWRSRSGAGAIWRGGFTGGHYTMLYGCSGRDAGGFALAT